VKKKNSIILSIYAIEVCFEFYQNQDFFWAYTYFMQGVLLDWSWLFNRGVIKIILSLYLSGKNKENKTEYFTSSTK
jgi:hypothetical protein